ncbi:CotH protein [Ruminococcaceae bacterium FB2012]|nr:CotH protein [Ruminococcaceae bacterium FB2012]
MKKGRLFAALMGAAAACLASVTVLASAVTLLPKEESQELDYTTVQAQYEANTADREKLFGELAASKTLPVVHITTQDAKNVTSKNYYVESVVDVTNCSDEFKLTAVAGVKVRGNSTANDTEKPYRIKFDKKQNMLGLHEGKKFKSWVLLRAFWNICPDYTAFNLAKALFEGKYYSSDATYCTVYMNGKYKGMYLLCEQNQAGKDRVNVYEPDEDEYQNEIGYFVEMDNYAGEDPYFSLDYGKGTLTDFLGVTRSIPRDDFSIKSDINTEEQLAFIKNYFSGAFKILHESVNNNKALMFDDNYNVVSAEGVYTPQQAVEAVFDTESVINMLLLEELCHDNDVGAGSFYYAVDFSENSKYPKLTFTAPWDFNWAYEGSTSGYYAGTWQEIKHDGWDRSNVWLIEFMNADWFRRQADEKWQRISGSGAITAALDKVQADIAVLRNDLPADESWRVDSGNNVVNYARGRAQWLDKNAPDWNKTRITKNDITLSADKFTYTGSEIKPGVTVKKDGVTLKEGRDYTVSYSRNTNVGSYASVKVTGIGECTGTATVRFAIEAAPMSKATVSIPYNSYTYRGREIKPSVKVLYSGKTLKEGTDYTLSYSGNTEVGTARITVTGKGSYKGTKYSAFTVKKLDLSSSYAKVTIPYSAYTYSGKEIKPAVTVKFKDGTVIPAGGYTLKYSNNVKVGVAEITVTGTGKNVTGTFKKTFVVKPAKNAIVSLTSAKAGAFKLTWKKGTAGTVGYQVLYSTDKNFKNNVHSYTSTDLKDLSENFSKVPKSGETWYVKVRSFYTKTGKVTDTRYGNYSAVKSVKVI